MNEIAINVPLNTVSFGVVGIALLRQAFRDKLNVNIFPIGGGVDLSAQQIDQEFGSWLQNSINNALAKHSRSTPITKLWHINGALESYSNQQNLLTFLETSELTKNEVNILKNQKTVFVTSNYTKRTMEEYGLKNVKYLELGFDSDNFSKLDKTYFNDGTIVHGVFGKLEICRKAHGKILRAWGQRYGNNPKYRLHACLFNPFLKPEDQNAIISQELQGKRYGNITFLPYLRTNAEFNDVVNSINVVIGMSRGEGRDMPVFHAVGLGKHCVGLQAHAYLDYLNNENAVMVNPCGKIKAQDGIFFHGDNAPFNVGSFYEWDDDEFINGLELATQRYLSNPVNEKGLELQKRTYKDTLDTLLKEI